MKTAKTKHASELKSQQSKHYREARNLTKAVVDTEEERNTALAEKDVAITKKISQ